MSTDRVTSVAPEGSGSGAFGGWFAGVLRHRGWVLGLTLAWGIAGLLVFGSLRRDLFPDLSLPAVQVLLQSPGRTAAELEPSIAQPVEQALGGIPGVRRVTTTLQAGVVQVVVAFESDVDTWRTRQLVAERLSAVLPDLPEGTSAPLLTSAAGRLLEIQELVLEGPTIDPMRLKDHAVRVLVPRLQSVPGVARIEILGGEERQLEIAVSPERMRLAGVSLAQVIEAVDGSERDASAGVLEIRDKLWYVTLGTLAATPDALRRVPVHTAHGLVALGDLAEVRMAPGFRMGLARYQGHEVVSMRVVRQPGAETLGTAERVRAALPELQRTLPDGMTLELFYDQGELVRRALGGVVNALLLGAVFVAVVLVLLLGSWRAALVVITLLPLATLGAAIPLRLMGLGLDAMTLGGLAVAVGLLVDAGVIMVENLAHRLRRHDEGGEAGSRERTLAAAAAEVAVPILTAVLVILAVFIPLLAVGGVAGRLYAPLAVSVASAMTISLVLSFTLVPALVARLLPPGTVLAEPWLVRRIKALYAPLLDGALRRGALVLLVALAITVPSVVLALRLGSDFLPELDEGALMLQTILPPDVSLVAVDEANRQVEAIVADIDGVRASYRRTGRGELTEDPMPHYISDVLVLLAEGADPAAVEAELAERVEHLPFTTELTTPMGMRIAEGIGGTPADIQVELFHPDLAALAERREAVERAIAAVPGVDTVTADTGGMLPRWELVPDDDALRRLDVPRTALLETTTAALQGIEVAPLYDGTQRVARVVRFPNDGRLTPETLRRLPIVVEEGRIVELGQVATITEEPTPSMIRRKNGQRRLGFNVRVESDLGGTARRVEEALRAIDLPRGTTVGLAGRIEEARDTQRRLLIAVAVALALVAVLLGLALGSLRDVLVVLATLPTAFAGGLYALWWAGGTWNASSIVGLIGLFGVAIQNSLVLITQTKGLLRAGLPPLAALREASLGRVRPKLMTAGSAILGLLPMLLGFGGSELERPLAIVMVGGLVTSTLFTLLALPAMLGLMFRRERQNAVAELP